MRIFVTAYNKPEYLTPQVKCLRKFIKEPFEFVCIDNSKEDRFTSQFITLCRDNNITYIRNQKPDHSLEGTSHYASLQWTWNTQIQHTNEIAVIIDHDNFPINPVSIEQILGDAQIAGVSQSRGHIEYFSPALLFFNTATMPNKQTLSFKGSLIEGQSADIGGELYFYLRDNPDVRRKSLGGGQILSNDPILSDLVKKYGYPHTWDLIESSFLHPRNGSNWSRVEKQEFIARDQMLLELLARRL